MARIQTLGAIGGLFRGLVERKKLDLQQGQRERIEARLGRQEERTERRLTLQELGIEQAEARGKSAQAISEKRLSLEERGLDLREETQGRTLDIRESEARVKAETLKADREAAQQTQKVIAGVNQSSTAKLKSRSQAFDVVKQLRNVASVEDKNARNAAIPALLQQFEKLAGAPLSDSIVQLIKKGKSEELLPIMQQFAQTVSDDATLDSAALFKLLTNPQASSQAIIRAGQPGATATPNIRLQESSQIKVLESQKQKLEKAIQQLPLRGKVAEEARKRFAGRISRLDNEIGVIKKEEAPLGEIERLVQQQDRLGRKGFAPNHPAMRAVDRKLKAIGSAKPTTFQIGPTTFSVSLDNGRTILNPKTRKFEPIESFDMAVPVSRALTASKASDLNLTPSAISEAAVAEVSLRMDAANMKVLIDNLKRTPGAVGLAGAISPAVSGLVAQAFGKKAGDKISKQLTGAKREDVTKVRLRLNAFVAQAVPVITREGGKRISDKELELTRRATRALEPTATDVEVIAGVSAVLALSFVNGEKQRVLQGKLPRLDVSDPVAAGARLVGELNLSFQDAADTIETLKVLQSLARRQ